MTATLERWWTPEGKVPTHQLLAPGSDAQKDFGLALFALHKAGAQACELVAKTAVADEHVLASALAETRAQMAPGAVHAVSKGVGGTQYAGLLLRDVLDDAEIAALALYRTCLAKSVAPPIAAQRVGMVYGVPSRDLNRYASVASDPKANPSVVSDMADRVLFDYVAKVVAEEFVGTLEDVSKASEYEQQHNVENGPGGRFARVREGRHDELSLQSLFDQAEAREAAPPEVGTKPTPTTGAPVQLRRQQRLKRQQRAKPVQQERQQMGRQQMRNQVLATQQLSRQALANQKLNVFDPTPLPLSGMPRSVPNMNATVPPVPFSSTVDASTSFVMTESEYLRLISASGDLPGAHVFRVGPLEEYAGKARIYQTGGQETEDHKAGIEHVLQVATSHPSMQGQANLVTKELTTDFSGPNGETLLDLAKRKFLEEEIQKGGYRTTVAAEMSKVEHAASLFDPDSMTLVWRPPMFDRSNTRIPQAKAPAIVELVIIPGAVPGRVTGNRVELDPNTPLLAQSLISRSTQLRKYWDPNRQAFRTQVLADSGTEEQAQSAKWRTGKSDDYLDQHNVTQGEHGRFVRERAVLPDFDLQAWLDAGERNAQPAEPRRMTRQTRQRRAQRAAPQPKQTLANQKLGNQRLNNQTMQKQSLQNQSLARQKARPSADEDEVLYTDPNELYAPLNPAEMQKALDDLGEKGWQADSMQTKVPLTSPALHSLLIHRVAGSDPVDQLLMSQGHAVWNKARGVSHSEDIFGHGSTGENPLYSGTLTSVDDVDIVTSFLAKKMDENPGIQMLKISMVPHSSGKVHLTVSYNAEKIPALHLVTLPAHDQERVTELVPGKTYRMHDKHSIAHYLRMRYYELESSKQPVVDVISNPHVKRWTLE